jgi:hypothetical protein
MAPQETLAHNPVRLVKYLVSCHRKLCFEKRSGNARSLARSLTVSVRHAPVRSVIGSLREGGLVGAAA